MFITRIVSFLFLESVKEEQLRKLYTQDFHFKIGTPVLQTGIGYSTLANVNN